MGRRASISTRLSLWYGGTILTVLVVFAAFCYYSFYRSLHRDYDRHLAFETRELVPFVDFRGDSLGFDRLGELTSVAYTRDGVVGTFVRLLSPEGKVLYESPNFSGHSVLEVSVPTEPLEKTVSTQWEGADVRKRYAPLISEGGRLLGWLEVTGFEWSIQTELANLLRILAGGIVISVLVALFLGFWLSRRALRPVAAMTEAARRIGGANLQDRLPAEFRVRDELTQLAETFNGLLDRLSASFERERRFTSNAAHELMTPLSTMKNEVEVTLRRSRSAEEYRECLDNVLEDADRLVGTAAGLLKLARAGSPEFVEETTVDLSVLVESVAGRYATRMDDAGIRFSWSAPPGIAVIGDQNALVEVLENLLENALRYTPREGRVSVRLRQSGGEAILEIEDSGIGFTQDEARQLFEQFFRGSGAREQARHGSGVGLAIVRTLVERLGGTVAAQSDGLGQGSLFRVTLRLSG